MIQRLFNVIIVILLVFSIHYLYVKIDHNEVVLNSLVLFSRQIELRQEVEVKILDKLIENQKELQKRCK